MVRRCSADLILVSWACLLGFLPTSAPASDERNAGRLRLVGSVSRDELDAVVSTSVSTDGRFLYASAWRAQAACVFDRDMETGRIEPRQSLVDADILDGTTALSLSPDGRYAISTAFRSRAAVLYRRDSDSGRLTVSDIARDEQDGVSGLSWAIDAAFAPDSRHVYVIDDRGAGDAGQGALTAFGITDDGQLAFLEANEGRDGCLAGARGIAIHPDGKTIFVACSRAGTLVVLDRDVETGRTTVRQVLRDEEGDVHGLDGAMGVCCSPDGKYVYTSSGRFQGDNTVCAFQVAPDGTLAPFQEFHDGEGELRDFAGGNEIGVSPDGRNVYAVATRSGSLACFRRDPETGRLSVVETLTDESGVGELAGAAGIGFSPDGRFVYVAAEEDMAITAYERDPGP